MTGSGESGKSTIVKQMKIIHQDGYSTDELLSWRLCVYKNLIESAKDLITATEKIQVQFENPHNKVGGRENFFSDALYEAGCPKTQTRSMASNAEHKQQRPFI